MEYKFAGTLPSEVTIAQALGVKEVGGQSLADSLIAYVREKHLLLLLDNFEQVVGAAPQISALLTAAARLNVLVTSRASLHLSGEHEYPLSPLPVPTDISSTDLEHLAQSDAVALLKEPCGPDDAAVKELMSGNICRCGAYANIVAAIQHVRKNA